MDGKGRCIDNVFIERPWRSLTYECVSLHARETGSQAKVGVARPMTCLTTTTGPTRPMTAGHPPRSAKPQPNPTSRPRPQLITRQILSKGWGAPQLA